MKLTETQAANFYMIFTNMAQSLVYVEDLMKDAKLDANVKREVVIPIKNKIQFLYDALLLKSPRREELKSHDALRFAEINRKLAMLSEADREEFENLLP